MKSQWWFERMAFSICSISSQLLLCSCTKWAYLKYGTMDFFCIFLIRTYKSCVIWLFCSCFIIVVLSRNLSLLGFPLGRRFFSLLISSLFLSLANQTFFSATNERKSNECMGCFYNAIIIFNVSHFVYRGRCCASCTNFQSLCWEIIISRSV